MAKIIEDVLKEDKELNLDGCTNLLFKNNSNNDVLIGIYVLAPSKTYEINSDCPLEDKLNITFSAKEDKKEVYVRKIKIC